MKQQHMKETMTDLPKQAQIANEIKTALANGAKLTSAELCARSSTALDSTDISRVIGDLKAAGLVAQSGTKKSTAAGGLAKAWAWIGPPDAAVPKSTAHRKPVATSVDPIEDEAPVAEAPSIEAPCGGWHASMQEPMTEEQRECAPKVVGVTDWHPLDHEQGVDPIELALAYLVDQADESILSFADAMLSDHPTWGRLRQMQDDAFQLLCDYRLTRTLEKS